jgi:aspartate/methionine/tyrosine aminotransferase
MSRPVGNPALAPFGTTIFADDVSPRAVEHGAINLGQGFPDSDGPQEVLDAAVAAIRRAAATNTRRARERPNCSPRLRRTSGASTGSSWTPRGRFS